MIKREYLILLLISLMVSFSCKRSYTGSYFTVSSVNQDGSLVLKNGDLIRLIGITPGEKVRTYLTQELTGEEIKLVFDGKLRSGRKKKGGDYWAYVLTKEGTCVNSELLKRGYSSLNTTYLSDSLASYRAYAGNPVDVSRPPINEPDNKTPGKQFTPAEIYKMYENSILVVYAGTGTSMEKLGTGFFVSDRIAITNHHVIEGGSSIYVKMKNGETLRVNKVLSYSKEFDYAILDVEVNSRVVPIPISTSPPEIGEDVVIIGNPKGLEFTLTKGVISALRDQSNTQNAIIQFDAAISSGNSGSPLINLYGQVIGVATFVIEDCQNCNFAYAAKLFNSGL